MNYMEEDKAVRNFIIIFVIVLLFVVGIYFFTVFVNKDNEPKNEDTNTSESTDVNIDTTKAIVGTMLQKSEKDYYVILYKSDDNKSSEYLSLETKYKATKDALPVYNVDLTEGMNSKYYDKEHINLSANNVNDLRFGDITLLEVKDGKIIKSFTNVEDIKKEWKIS